MLTPLLDARNEVTNPHGYGENNPNHILGAAVHHSVSWYPQSYANATETLERAHIREIDALHVQEGYGGFGYHLTAFPSGRLYQCGDLLSQRAHVTGNNDKLLGIVAIGRFDAGYQYPPNDKQLAALASGIQYLQEAVFIGRTVSGGFDIHGHNDWATLLHNGDPTACAGLLNNIGDWYPRALKLVQDEPAPGPEPGPPVYLPVTYDGPAGTKIVLEERGIRFFVNGVNVWNMGDFGGEEFKGGQLSKNFGGTFEWLRHGDKAAFFSPEKGD